MSQIIKIRKLSKLNVDQRNLSISEEEYTQTITLIIDCKIAVTDPDRITDIPDFLRALATDLNERDH